MKALLVGLEPFYANVFRGLIAASVIWVLLLVGACATAEWAQLDDTIHRHLQEPHS